MLFHDSMGFDKKHKSFFDDKANGNKTESQSHVMRTRGGRKKLFFDNILLKCLRNGFCIGMYVEFGIDSFDVCPDGFATDAQFISRHPISKTFGEEFQNLHLSG